MSTGIGYVDETWSPIVGCTKCSPGCDNCWAEKMAYRLKMMGKSKYFSVVDTYRGEHLWTNKVYCDEKALQIPLHWRKPRRILTCSMGDMFHPKVPFEFISKVWDVMFDCMNIANNPVHLYRKSHTFMVLTKRPKRLLEFANWMSKKCQRIDYPNVHLGITICNQAEADEKIPILLQIPAAHRWLSIEPLLEEIDLMEMLPGHYWYDWEKGCLIDYIVIGCESGPHRRPCKLEWVKSIVDQCKAAGVKCWVKQLEINGKAVHNLKDMPDWTVQEI